MPKHLPVWYLQAGSAAPDGTGFTIGGEGSAVLIAVENDEDDAPPRRMLLTAQHVLRNGAGEFHSHFRAWPPGMTMDDGYAVPVTLDGELKPPTYSDAGDWALLRIPLDLDNARFVPVARHAGNGRTFTVAGYYAGGKHIQSAALEGVVTPLIKRRWQLQHQKENHGMFVIASGENPLGPGMSGGGVFRQFLPSWIPEMFNPPALAGIYRGKYAGWTIETADGPEELDAGEHLMVSAEAISNHLPKGWHFSTTLPLRLLPWIAVGGLSGILAAFVLGVFFIYSPWLWLTSVALGLALAASSLRSLKTLNSTRPPTPLDHSPGRGTAVLLSLLASLLLFAGATIALISTRMAVVVPKDPEHHILAIRNSTAPEGSDDPHDPELMHQVPLKRSILGLIMVCPKKDIPSYRFLEVDFDGRSDVRLDNLSSITSTRRAFRFYDRYELE